MSSFTANPVNRIQSDVRRKTVLPAGQSSAATSVEQPADEYLDGVEEELNKRVDRDVEVLIEGMAELVKLADIQDKDHFKVTQDAFQSTVRTESMIRSAHSLLALSHTLKLLHLFTDTKTPALARARLADEAKQSLEEARQVVMDLAAKTA